jgi:hypothetical protein
MSGTESGKLHHSRGCMPSLVLTITRDTENKDKIGGCD